MTKLITTDPKSRIWEKQNRNYAMYFDGFYLSYNSGDFGIPAFVSDTGDSETAICTNQHKFYILNGDYRKELERIATAGGLKACLEFYKNHEMKEDSNENS